MAATRDDRDARRVTILLTRDSVCMADDVDAPHEHALVVAPADDLSAIASHIADLSYLPMPSDAWGWVIEAGDAAIAIRPGLLSDRTTMILRGDPKAVVAADLSRLDALYVRPASSWRSLAPPPRRIAPIMLYIAFGAMVVILSGLWFAMR